MSDSVLSYAIENKNFLIEELKNLGSCASIGADSEMLNEMEKARQIIEKRLGQIGFLNIQRLSPLSKSGHSSIYAERLDCPGKPTILIYAHYDVQPPDPISKWKTPPFEPTIINEKIYGRGLSDDKGPMLIALETLAAFIFVEGKLPINIKILIEGEEEIGSPSLAKILKKHRTLLSADAVLSADGARWRPDLISLNVGSRGNAGFEIKLTTASQDLHSGRYGGIVRNPLHEMAKLLSILHDDNGSIAAPGFYEGVIETTEKELNEIKNISYDDNKIFEETGAQPFGEAGFSTLERLWFRPSLDVNGMWGGYIGEGSKTVIPNEAFAKITMRLVSGQDPIFAQNSIISYLKKHLPQGSNLEIFAERGFSASYTVPKDHPLLIAASNALEITTGKKPLKVRIGASLPLTDIVYQILGIDTIMFSFALSDENFHAPNEFFRLNSITEGLKAWVQIIREISKKNKSDFDSFKIQ